MYERVVRTLTLEVAPGGNPLFLAITIVVGEVPIVVAHLDPFHGECGLNEPRRGIETTV
jgi:hypothetical protein